MSNKELVSPEGLRVDGRRANELRQIQIQMGLFARADGSCYYEQGNTKLLVAVYGPREIPNYAGRHDRAIINCEYTIASFSAGERKKKTKHGRQAQELALLIQQVFESAILTELSPKSQIDIYIQVLQSDGGTKCASINAACLALIDAGVPMKDFVVSCSAGHYDKTPLLDLNYYEDSSGSPDMSVAILPRSGNITLLQMDSKLNVETFEEVLQCATNGCQKIYDILLSVVKERTQTLLNSRGSFEQSSLLS